MRAQPGYKKTRAGNTLPRMLPFGRKARDLEDYYPNLDGRHGYCFCGCGEKTSIAKATNAMRGTRAGEPVSFLQGHHQRVKPYSGKLSEDQIQQIRYLWKNAPLSSGRIADIVCPGTTKSYVRSVANNEKARDPSYEPPTQRERHNLLYGIVSRRCPICGDPFEVSRGKVRLRQRITCLERECVREYRRRLAVESGFIHERSAQERAEASRAARERWESGIYDSVARPPTPLQLEWASQGFPDERPAYVEPDHWEALRLHLAEGLSYEECARRFGGSSHRYQYRAKRAAEDLRRGTSRSRVYPKKREAALRRWRDAKGQWG